jgi:Protein of unknown function (DUF3485)
MMNEPTPNPTLRLAWLLVIVGGVLSLAFVLPRHPARESAVRMALPEGVSFWATAETFQHWKGGALEPSKAEKEKLASDTEFEKMSYVLTDAQSGRPLIKGWHEMQASIVLSGHDLNDSIHRPERCLPAQGFKELRLSPLTVRTPSGNVAVSRITCYQEQLDQTTHKLMVGNDGHPIRLQHVFYYWFVGSHSLTASHYDRTLIDMKDRLLGGFDQRWAYVLLGGQITDTLVMNHLLAGDPAYPSGRSEAETDSLLQKLVSAISRESIHWDKIRP